MKNSIAISVDNVSKTFKIPHEKISTLRGAFVSALHEKSYEKFSALKNVSFEVKKGEFFGIIGRNGSGKSTLLKILAGIYTADKGNIEVNGLISPFLELGIGFNPELSGRDNIYLNASVLGLTKKEIDKKYNDIVAFSELKRFIDQKVKNYSSGMSVRLAFSVAIHANRDILLMDEVLAVGDTNFQNKCFEEFNKYRNQGKTVVLVTHDTSAVHRYCDRAMLLRKGKIEMLGTSEKVCNKYLFQNMSDEEKRIIAEEKRQREKAKNKAGEKIKKEEDTIQNKVNYFNFRIGNKEAVINKVTINGSSKECILDPLDEINIKIEYNASKVDGAFLGIAIYPVAGREHIFSFDKKINTKNKKIKIVLAANYLNPGLYYLSVGLADKNMNWGRPYDLIEKNYKFRIKSKKQEKDLIQKSTCNIPFDFIYEK